MAPVLFNLYTCPLMEHWAAKVEEHDRVGIQLKYKMDKKLFRQYTRNAEQMKIDECLFADDEALLSSTQAGAESTVSKYQTTNAKFGLTVSIPSTKKMVVGRKQQKVRLCQLQWKAELSRMLNSFHTLDLLLPLQGPWMLMAVRRKWLYGGSKGK